MNREIKFRGLDLEHKYMVFGSLINYNPIPEIQETTLGELDYDYPTYEIVPESVGQFIGITDSMDKDIFTGDIVIDLKSRKYTVEFNDEFCAFFLYPIDDRESFMGIYPNIVLSIIGNIHENAELLNQPI